MAEFNFSITAHVGDDAMLIYSATYLENFTRHLGNNPVKELAKMTMPYRDWVIDDGEDERGTSYCQYASYESNDTYYGNYLLAVWCEVDENGCMKL